MLDLPGSTRRRVPVTLTSHHHPLDGLALTRGQPPRVLTIAMLRSSPDRRIPCVPLQPVLRAGAECTRPVAFTGQTVTREWRPHSFMRPRDGPDGCQSTFPFTCTRAFALQLTLAHYSCRRILTCWLTGCRKAISDFTGPSFPDHHRSGSPVGKGQLRPPRRFQTLPPYLV